ncbi:hypothetical protein [Pseudomonas fluorescens]|uniref:hypothetical protein n=1 Tax=Pseudomonas fluorescens TaxID=294 RepID=UPI001F0770CB|nr:hypothetical protein [Pseudomonas fluorescens]
MQRNMPDSTEPNASRADIAQMIGELGGQVENVQQLLSACHDSIKSDADLQGRMALIDELYSHADSEDHAAARFAELVADRVYKYETETVFIPYPSPSATVDRAGGLGTRIRNRFGAMGGVELDLPSRSENLSG